MLWQAIEKLTAQRPCAPADCLPRDAPVSYTHLDVYKRQVLARARVVGTLDEALDGISHLCATAMTPRDFGPPTRSPREHFDLLLHKEQTVVVNNAEKPEKTQNSRPQPLGVAFLFGSERFGMRNEDVYRSHCLLYTSRCV